MTATLGPRAAALFAALALAGCGRLDIDALHDAAARDAGLADAAPADAALAAPTLRATMKAQVPTAGSELGTSVAVSQDGQTIVSGAFNEPSAATGVDGNQNDASKPGAGAAYVYERDATGWSQTTYLKASNTDSLDNFGEAIAISSDGSTIVVGAEGEQSGNPADQADNSVPNAGAAYVFVRSGSSWVQQAYLKSAAPTMSASFGAFVALSADGSTIAASDFANGSAYVYRRTGTIWSAPTTVGPAGALGLSVDGMTLAIASLGGLTVYQATGSAWSMIGQVAPPSGAQNFGVALATGAAGASVVSNVQPSSSGTVYGFVGTAPSATVSASDAVTGDGFGWSVGMSGDGATFVVGAHNSLSRVGAAYVFSHGVQLAELVDPVNNDGYGEAIAVSSDASTVVVGLPGDSTGVNDSGAVFVYR